jgi:hypothetical protein
MHFKSAQIPLANADAACATDARAWSAARAISIYVHTIQLQLWPKLQRILSGLRDQTMRSPRW